MHITHGEHLLNELSYIPQEEPAETEIKVSELQRISCSISQQEKDSSAIILCIPIIAVSDIPGSGNPGEKRLWQCLFIYLVDSKANGLHVLPKSPFLATMLLHERQEEAAALLFPVVIVIVIHLF